MAGSLRIIFIHGINAQTTNYSQPLYQKILAACRDILCAQNHSTAEADAILRRLIHHEIFWAELTTDLTNRYLQLAYERPRFFWNFLTRPIDPLMIQIMHYIKDKGDKHSGPMNILKNVDADIRRVCQPGEHAIIVAHSLGSVIAFDYVIGFRPPHRLDSSINVDSFITMGSPIPLFTSAMGHPDSAATLPPNVRKWVNIASPRDAIARPLQPFFANIPVSDHQIRTRFLPLDAHASYWNDGQTASIIAHEVIAALGLAPASPQSASPSALPDKI